MADVILYFASSGFILALLYLIYILILRNETFFSLNRYFLIGILLFSLLFPFLRFDPGPLEEPVVTRSALEIRKFRTAYYEALAVWSYRGNLNDTTIDPVGFGDQARDSVPNLVKLAFNAVFIIYIIGVVFFLSRTLWTFYRIRQMVATCPREKIRGLMVVKTPYQIAPFSFLKYVFVPESKIYTPEFDQILAHEQAHIHQGHSIDLIGTQVLAAFFWFNPVIWRLIRSLKTIHEFIADEKIIGAGYPVTEYQALLLSQLIGNNTIGLAHNFNLSFIKKRIKMMKVKRSGRLAKIKVAVVITGTLLFGALIIRCNSTMEAQDTLKPGYISGLPVELPREFQLPVIPKGFVVTGNTEDVLHFVIAGNRLYIDGHLCEVKNIIPLIENTGKPTLRGQIDMRVDKDQPMKLIREVQTELRKARRRKIMYYALSADGSGVAVPLLLPPSPEEVAKYSAIPQPDADVLEAAGRTDLLRIEMGDRPGPGIQQKVNAFIKSHMEEHSTDYVVSAHFRDEDTFNDYLVSLQYIKAGFQEIYEARSHELFGKDFADLSRDEFLAARKGVPMNISIAE